jgi:hypothetical protein
MVPTPSAARIGSKVRDYRRFELSGPVGERALNELQDEEMRAGRPGSEEKPNGAVRMRGSTRYAAAPAERVQLDRQPHCEFAALPEATADGSNIAAMRFHNGPHQGKADAKTRAGARCCGLGLHKEIKDMR